MHSYKTIVVLPTYNELDNLPKIITDLLALPIIDLEILIVDDNSPDGTGILGDQLALTHPNKIHVLHRSSKEGLGRAYIAGFKWALLLDADYIIQMDADLSHQPTYIPAMITLASESDLVIGSRYVSGGSVDKNWNIMRKLLSWFANTVYLPSVLAFPIKDATGGYRLWRRETLIGVDLERSQSNGYIFQTEMADVTYRLGYKIAEVPIHFLDRTEGKSKMDFKIQIEAAFRVWHVRSHYHILKPEARRLTNYVTP